VEELALNLGFELTCWEYFQESELLRSRVVPQSTVAERRRSIAILYDDRLFFLSKSTPETIARL